MPSGIALLGSTALDRTPEPELMNEPDQVEAYAAADFSSSDAGLIDRLVELFPSGLGHRLLDLGCGPGNISFRLAERYPGAFVMGFDGASAMVNFAQARHQAEPMRWPNLSFTQALLKGEGVEIREPEWAYLASEASFTGLVSNSLLHHLHNPQVLWSCLRQMAAPGAKVYIKDLRRPESPQETERLLAIYLPDSPEVLQRDYVASLHAAFTPQEVAEQLQMAGLAACLRVRAVDDCYLEVFGRISGCAFNHA